MSHEQKAHRIFYVGYKKGSKRKKKNIINKSCCPMQVGLKKWLIKATIQIMGFFGRASAPTGLWFLDHVKKKKEEKILTYSSFYLTWLFFSKKKRDRGELKMEPSRPNIPLFPSQKTRRSSFLSVIIFVDRRFWNICKGYIFGQALQDSVTWSSTASIFRRSSFCINGPLSPKKELVSSFGTKKRNAQLLHPKKGGRSNSAKVSLAQQMRSDRQTRGSNSPTSPFTILEL